VRLVRALQQGLHEQRACSETLVPTRVYALVLGEPEGGSEVVTDTAPILRFEASILLDLGLPTFSYL
jgi:hypothetical protein